MTYGNIEIKKKTGFHPFLYIFQKNTGAESIPHNVTENDVAHVNVHPFYRL